LHPASVAFIFSKAKPKPTKTEGLRPRPSPYFLSGGIKRKHSACGPSFCCETLKSSKNQNLKTAGSHPSDLKDVFDII